ncbi:MAG: MFS transporter [Planctomycetia bacterium]|nr:MFS transporter [Planctomycetia bacterium]
MSTDNPAPASSPETASRPTRVRHVVVAVTVLMAVVLYLDRFCVSFAERYIKEDLGLTEREIAHFISAFFWAYALGQVPSGWLSDRLSSRGVLALYIVSWSFFTAMIGAAAGFAMLLAMRLGCGLSQAGAYPTAGALLGRWVPFSGRGLASGLVALGGRVGAVIAPILTAYLMVIFVPLSTPADLDARSILDGPALCAKLTAPPSTAGFGDAPPIGERIFRRLPAEVQPSVVTYGELQRQRQDAETRRAAAGKPAEPAPPVPMDASDVQALVAGLDALLSSADLFEPRDFDRLKNLEREALGLQARRQKGESLSDAETVRLNRLFLEGLFAKEIGKLYVKGWRPVLLVYGIAGLAVAATFWFCFRNSPAEHPWCNAAERSLIGGEAAESPGGAAAARTKFPARAILTSLSLWMSSISQFTTNMAWLFFVTFFARYLSDVHHVPILDRSVMAAVPPMAGIVGMFLGGHLTDSLVQKIGLRWGRALPMALTRFGAAAAYLACLWIDSPWPATIAFASGFLFVDLGVSAVWAFMQDVGGKHVGAILGWGNMWGNFGAALAPLLYDRVLGPDPKTADWNVMFLVCAGLFVVSGLSGLWINATVPIVAANEEPPARNSE